MFQDKEDPRLSQLVSPAANLETRFAVQGYPDDEGIRTNGGRPGAAEAPAIIREVLYKMTPEEHWPVHPFLVDQGDLAMQGLGIEAKQSQGRQKVATHFRSTDAFLFSLGGGHDFGFPDTAGFMDVFGDHKKKSQPKPLIINFDAHMDVRPTIQGPSSGTPFRQLLSEFKDTLEFVEVGIQPHCNSYRHIEWALENKVKILRIDEIRRSKMIPALKKRLKPQKKRPAFISFDIDAFCASLAPGCSASWPGGLTWEEALDALRWLLQNFDVKGLGIYEVSPSLDVHKQTSRLAARLIFETMRVLLPKKTALAPKKKRR